MRPSSRSWSRRASPGWCAAPSSRAASVTSSALIAFDQDADYDSPNFLWFRERYGRFVYVDRNVVAPAQRVPQPCPLAAVRSVREARRLGHDQIVCEVNTEPPNPASEAFHARLASSSRSAGRAARRRQGGALSQARAFSRSRISVSSSCSLVGGAGGGGAACSLHEQAVDALDHQEQHPGDDEEVDRHGDEAAVAQGGACLLGGVVGRRLAGRGRQAR